MKTEIKNQSAILVGIQTNTQAIWTISDSLQELKELSSTAGIKVTECLYQSLKKHNSKHYVGKGKIEEIKQIILVQN